MAVGKEARLILRLVDGVTGPGKAIVAALGGVNRAVGRMTSTTMLPARALAASASSIRRATYDLAPVGAGLSIGIAKAAKDVYNLEKQLNVSVAAGNLTLDQREALMEKAVELNADYAATSAEIVGGANELLKAGMNYDQSTGAIEGILDTAQAMDVSISDASAAVVNSMVALRMEMGTTDAAMKSSKKLADLYAHAVNETTASLEDFSVSGKYFNPVAAAMGMSPEEAMAWQVSLAKAGIRGSSAGTGLRSAPVSIAAPSKGARESLARLGINAGDFVGKRTGEASGSSLAAVLEASGFNSEGMEEAIDQLIANPAFKNAPAKLANAIVSQFSDDLGIATAEDKSAVSSTLQDAINAGVSNIDMAGFLKRLKAQGAGVAEYAAIFGKQHASKMMAIDPDAFDKIYAQILAESEGTAARMRAAMMAGIVGDVAEFTAAMEKMSVAIGKSGLLADASKAIDRVATSIAKLADSNPQLIRLGSYAILAAAALAPLGFIASGVAASLGLLLNPLAVVVGGLGALVALNLGPISDALAVFGKSLRAGLSEESLSSLKAVKEAVTGLFDLRLDGDGGDALGQTARNLGLAAADIANGVSAALPKIRDFGSEMLALGSGAWIQLLARMQPGLDQLQQSIMKFASTKVEAIAGVGSALADFYSRASPILAPAATAALNLVGDSFNAIAAGLGAIGRVADAATSVLAGVVTGFLDEIDPATVDALSTSLSRLFTDLSGGIRDISGAANTEVSFDALKFGLESGRQFASELNQFVRDIQDIADALDKAVTKLGNAWKQAQSIFMGEAAAGTINADPLQPYTGPANGPATASDGARASSSPTPAPVRAASPLKGAEANIRSPAVDSYLADVSRIQDSFWGLDAKAREGMAGVTAAVSAEGESATAAAQKVGTDITTSLNVTARPTVDVSSVLAASGAVDNLAGKIANLKGAMATVSASVGASTSPAPRSNSGPDGKRAAGGPIRAGLTYNINERGDEQITLGKNGYVSAAHRVREPEENRDTAPRSPVSVVNHNTFHIRSTDPRGAANEIAAALGGALQRSSQLAIDGR